MTSAEEHLQNNNLESLSLARHGHGHGGSSVMVGIGMLGAYLDKNSRDLSFGSNVFFSKSSISSSETKTSRSEMDSGVFASLTVS